MEGNCPRGRPGPIGPYNPPNSRREWLLWRNDQPAKYDHSLEVAASHTNIAEGIKEEELSDADMPQVTMEVTGKINGQTRTWTVTYPVGQKHSLVNTRVREVTDCPDDNCVVNKASQNVDRNDEAELDLRRLEDQVQRLQNEHRNTERDLAFFKNLVNNFGHHTSDVEELVIRRVNKPNKNEPVSLPGQVTGDADTPTRNTKHKPNLLGSPMEKVVRVMDAIEEPDDPFPNAFYDVHTGNVRVYHGAVYGNPRGDSWPSRQMLRSDTVWGQQHYGYQGPYWPCGPAPYPHGAPPPPLYLGYYPPPPQMLPARCIPDYHTARVEHAPPPPSVRAYYDQPRSCQCSEVSSSSANDRGNNQGEAPRRNRPPTENCSCTHAAPRSHGPASDLRENRPVKDTYQHGPPDGYYRNGDNRWNGDDRRGNTGGGMEARRGNADGGMNSYWYINAKPADQNGNTGGPHQRPRSSAPIPYAGRTGPPPNGGQTHGPPRGHSERRAPRPPSPPPPRRHQSDFRDNNRKASRARNQEQRPPRTSVRPPVWSETESERRMREWNDTPWNQETRRVWFEPTSETGSERAEREAAMRATHRHRPTSPTHFDNQKYDSFGSMHVGARTASHTSERTPSVEW